MKINYCLPIIKQTKQEVLTMIENNQEYDYFEVWLDYVTDLDETFVQELISNLKEKLIILFRRQKLEQIHMHMKQRKNILKLVANTSFFIDLDISSQLEELLYIQQHDLKTNLIMSYHHYEETPTAKELEKIIKEMEEYTPAIYKIATYCQSESDAIRLLQTLEKLKQEKKKYIVLGMGEKGSVTRIYGTLWGNEMIFAPKEKAEHSAPGQLTKEALETIFTNLSF